MKRFLIFMTCLLLSGCVSQNECREIHDESNAEQITTAVQIGTVQTESIVTIDEEEYSNDELLWMRDPDTYDFAKLSIMKGNIRNNTLVSGDEWPKISINPKYCEVGWKLRLKYGDTHVPGCLKVKNSIYDTIGSYKEHFYTKSDYDIFRFWVNDTYYEANDLNVSDITIMLPKEKSKKVYGELPTAITILYEPGTDDMLGVSFFNDTYEYKVEARKDQYTFYTYTYTEVDANGWPKAESKTLVSQLIVEDSRMYEYLQELKEDAKITD